MSSDPSNLPNLNVLIEQSGTRNEQPKPVASAASWRGLAGAYAQQQQAERLHPSQMDPAATAVARTHAETLDRTILWAVVKEIRSLAAARSITSEAAMGEWLKAADEDLANRFSPSAAWETLKRAVTDSETRFGPLAEFLRDSHITDLTATGTTLTIKRMDAPHPAPTRAWWRTTQELLDWIQQLAVDHNTTFSETTPLLQLNLENMARVVAVAWVGRDPYVSIRFHRHKKVTLPDLVHLDAMTPEAAEFLQKAVHTQHSIIVSGAQGAGKTTTIRALAEQIPSTEAVGCLETDHELFLRELKEWTVPPLELRTRDGGTEQNMLGQRAGQLRMVDAILPMLRLNLDRIVVGEVRGADEIIPLIKAMQTGAGTLATTHAVSATDTIGRLVTSVQEAGYTREYAHEVISRVLDVVVHMRKNAQGKREISEIIVVHPGEGGAPAIETIFRQHNGTLTRTGHATWERNNGRPTTTADSNISSLFTPAGSTS